MNATKRRRILVTGATGFSGKELTLLLSEDKSAELFLTGRTAREGFYQCDLSDFSVTRRLISDIKPDQTYHLAGSFTNRYEEDYNSNFLSAKNILDALRESSNKGRVLLIGSAAEYGAISPEDLPVKEDHPLRPTSVYGLTKVFQTKLMGLYVPRFGMDIVMARSFNLSGKGIPPVLMVGKIWQEIEKYKRGEVKVITVDDFSAERDYIDIEKAVRYYQIIMERGKTGEVYNVGEGKGLTGSEIVSKMLAAEGLPAGLIREAEHSSSNKLAIPKIYADITKLKNLG